MSIFDKQHTPDPGVEKFWRETEESIGEAVLAQGLAQYHSGGEEEGPLWGLVYVTSTRLFFRHFPQESWFSSFLGGKNSGIGDEGRSARTRDVTLEWPLSGYTHVEEEQERTSIKTVLLGKRPGRITLVAQEGGRPIVLSVEHNRSAVLSAVAGGMEG